MNLVFFRTHTLWTSFLLVMTKRQAHHYTILTTLQHFTSLKRELSVMAPISHCQWWTDTTIVECLWKKQLILLTSALWRSDQGWLWHHQTLLLKLLTRMVQENMLGVNQSRILLLLQLEPTLFLILIGLLCFRLYFLSFYIFLFHFLLLVLRCLWKSWSLNGRK